MSRSIGGAANRLVVSNVFAKLHTRDKDLLENLSKEFTKKTWVFSKAGRFKKIENGKVMTGFPQVAKFVHKGTGKFLTGLLPEVAATLREWEVPFELAYDGVDPVEYDEVSEDSLDAIKLRDYQMNAANLALANRRGVIKCATGGGKTAIFSAILKSLEETQWPALVLARRTALIDQAYDALRRYGVNEVGRVHGTIFEPKRITVSTVQSLGKIMDEWKLKAKVLIVDECHEMTTTQSMQIMQSFENATYRLGFSATPFVANDEIRNYRLKGLFGPLLCDISTSELQGQDVLSTSEAHFHYIDEPKRGLRAARMPFQQIEEAGIVYNDHFHQKVKSLVDNITEGRILILVSRLQHGENLKRLLPDAHWIKGEDSPEARNVVFEQLRRPLGNKKKVVAIMSSIGFYGLDVFVHYLINATGGKDSNMLIQKIGRGLRRAADKDKLEYHDFIFTFNPALQSHSEERMKVLEKQGHPVIVRPRLEHSIQEDVKDQID